MNVSFVTATYRDLRVIETIQSLRMHHGLSDADIVVVDNAPGSPESRLIEDFCRKTAVHYIPYGDAVGTSPARNRAIMEAQNEWVVCFDSHVLFPPGFPEAINRAIDFAGDRKILFHFVKVFDDLNTHPATHFAPFFRHGMLGIWRYDPRAELGEPFEIPASGLGAFLVRKRDFFEAGGFHPAARGFGGEEVCYHEMFRRAGGVVMCHPALRYWHNFYRLEVPFPLFLYDKVRNYVLWFRTLGWDIDRIKRHFVRGHTIPEVSDEGEVCDVSPNLLSEQEFNSLLENIDKPYEPPALVPAPRPPQQQRRCGSCGDRPPRPELEAIAHKLADLGYGDDQVAVVTVDPRWARLLPRALYRSPAPSVTAERLIRGGIDVLPEPDGTEVLIYDPPQPLGLFFDRIKDSLYKWPTIAFANTGLADEITVTVYRPDTKHSETRSETTILKRVREWLTSTGSVYVVLAAETEGAGFILVSREARFATKALPSFLERLKGFTFSAIKHLASGAATVPEEVFQERLNICALCDRRQGEFCTVCGCPIRRKARWAVSRCPLGKW